MWPSCHLKFQNSSLFYVLFSHEVGRLRVLVKPNGAGWQVFATRMFGDENKMYFFISFLSIPSPLIETPDVLRIPRGTLLEP